MGKICDRAAVSRKVGGRSKPTEPSARGRAKDIGGVALAPIPSDGQQRSAVYTQISIVLRRDLSCPEPGLILPARAF